MTFGAVDGLYQVRFSANLTIVDAPDGLVIIDTTVSTDHSRAGMELFRRATGNDKPVVAVIYTHTHFDHYGGVKGVIEEADVAAGKVPIVAPGTIASFNKYAIGENVITGNRPPLGTPGKSAGQQNRNRSLQIAWAAPA